MMAREDKLTLETLDVSPRGVTEIDLLGQETEIGFRPWGSTYATRLRGWTPAHVEPARIEREAVERMLKSCTKKEMLAFLEAHGHGGRAWGKKTNMRTTVMIVINELRYPREFVNAAPNVYVCGCGHEGPATKNGVELVCGAACGRPGYLLNLQVRVQNYDWYKAKKAAQAQAG